MGIFTKRRSPVPEKKTVQRALKDKQEGKAPSTQAGEFVHEEMDHIRTGKHGAKSTKQAIAIGLSKARRAGVAVKPKKGTTTSKAKSAPAKKKAPVSKTRSKATTRALKKEPRTAASKSALSRQAKSSARKKTPQARSTAAKKAAKKK